MPSTQIAYNTKVRNFLCQAYHPRENRTIEREMPIFVPYSNSWFCKMGLDWSYGHNLAITRSPCSYLRTAFPRITRRFASTALHGPASLVSPPLLVNYLLCSTRPSFPRVTTATRKLPAVLYTAQLPSRHHRYS